MFQIKDFASIVLGMINRAKATQDKITDFRVGSVARTLFESPAAEIDELYQNMFIGLKEAIPTAIYTSFVFDRLAAVPASGIVRVTITSSGAALVIAAGTEFSIATSAQKYVSQSDATIPSGDTFADVFVSSTNAGTSGNLLAGTEFTLSPSPAGFLSAANSASFLSGADLESDEQRKARFVEYIQTLNRGTVAALQFGAKQARLLGAEGVITEQVRSSVVIEPWLTNASAPVALVELYIHNGVNGASGQLIAETAKIIDGYVDTNGARIPGWKAAGVKVNVYAAALVTINLTAAATIAAGYDASATIASVSAAIANYIAQLPIAGPVLRAEMIAAAMEVPGVDNFVITTPAGDVTIGATSKASVGTFTITEA